jgi:hypothetical protein
MNEEIGSRISVIVGIMFATVIIQNKKKENQDYPEQNGRSQVVEFLDPGFSEIVFVEPPKCINRQPEKGNSQTAVKQIEELARFKFAGKTVSVPEIKQPGQIGCQHISDDVSYPDGLLADGHKLGFTG